MIQRRRYLIDRQLQFAIFIVFFLCLGALFIALPSSKAPFYIRNDDYSTQIQLEAFQNYDRVADSILKRGESLAAAAAVNNEIEFPDVAAGGEAAMMTSTAETDDQQPSTELMSFPIFLEDRPAYNLFADDVCVPPILQPEPTEKRSSTRTCLQRNGANPVAVAVFDIVEKEGRSRKVRRSLVVPTSEMKLYAHRIHCSYSPIVALDDFHIRYEPPQPLDQLPAVCPTEVFLISCTYPDVSSSNSQAGFNNNNNNINASIGKVDFFNSVFRCMIPQVPPSPAVPPQYNNRRVKSTLTRKTRFEDRLNIVMIGLDSLSRVTWLEQLPKTSTFFADRLGGTILEGYNIVGDGTTVALLALLTGHFYNELHESRRGFPNASAIDDFPFLWKLLKEQANYTTMYDEDQPTIGTFQHRMMGFAQQPVDYYGRWFQMAFREKAPRSYDCIGSLPSYEEMLNQIKYLYSFHPDPQQKFALLFNGAHSRPASDGTQDVTQLDNLLLASLQRFNSLNQLNKTLLILFSDHGARNGKGRATPRGKLEERMPFFGMAFPKWWLEKYPLSAKNLRDASRRLTTPFDLHRTLLEVGGLDDQAPIHSGKPWRGLSLFEPLPGRRSCDDAGVLPHWCSCQLAVKGDLDKTNNDEEINSLNMPSEYLLAAFKRFADSALQPVAEFCESLIPRDPFITKVIAPNYVQMSFWTSPGNGQWEVTFKISDRNEASVADSSQVSRTNSYGAAPACIAKSHPHLRELCYCKGMSRQRNTERR